MAAGVVVSATFVPKAEAALPAGGRSWELVTDAEPTSARTFSVWAMNEDDERFAYSTFGPAPGSESGPFVTFRVAERGQTGWTNRPLSMPYSVFEDNEILYDLEPLVPAAFSADLHTGAWISSMPLTQDAPPEKEFGLYRKTDGQAPEFIAKVGTGAFTFAYPGFVDIAKDGGRVIFTTEEHLLAADAGRSSGESIYAWDGATRSLQLLDVDNGGNLLSPCGAHVSQANGMSATADLVFFTVPACEGNVAKVYVRDLTTDTTTQVSASECARIDCNAAQDATFVGATSDGSAAFITTKQQLTDEDHDEAADLYRYDVATGELTLLSGGSAEASGEVLQEQVYPSDDGSRVYFRGTGEVIHGESSTGEKMFLADAGGVRFVAQISFPTKPEIQVSADGTRALFVTQTQLLPSDTDSQQDVYLYDAGQEAVTQISTSPSGGNGPYAALFSSPIERPELETMGDFEPFFAIDGSGEHLFFYTAEALVPEDVNEKVDVYEWSNGQLGLISSGEDGFDSGFAGVSRNGRTVLFVTNASLLPADRDGGNRDFYVARVGGGFPEEEGEEGCDVKLCPVSQREQLVRPTPKSLSPSAGEGGGHIRVIRVGSKKAGVVGRSTAVLAEVPRPGLVSASVWVRDGGKRVVLAAGSAHATRPGKVRIELRPTRSGQNSSAAHIRKGLLTVKEGDSMISQAVKLDLG
jgi:hypothetical protein